MDFLRGNYMNYKKIFAFLLVWFCSGITMYAYQTNNEIVGLLFTFLSSLYFALVYEKENKNV